MSNSTQCLRSSYAHVRWLGGSPCSGKSTVSQLLCQAHGWRRYAVDDALESQMPRITPEQHPALSAWMAASCDERWLQPVDALLANVIACYGEHFRLIVEDLSALPDGPPVLAEGTALLPGLVRDLGVPSDHALWMMPTPAFQRRHYSRRPWIADMLADCSDPARAFDGWMKRDSQFARWAAGEAERCGYRTLWVDGSVGIEGQAEIVAAALRSEAATA